MDDSSPLSEFLDLLRNANLRFLQEREVGLDVYLSGPWGIVPAVLAVVALTIFALALFHLIPWRSRSVPLILAAGLLALVVGVVGSYVEFLDWREPGGVALPRVFTDGQGSVPVTDRQSAALLAVPALVGAATLALGVGCAVFLLLFGAPEGQSATEGDEGGKGTAGGKGGRRSARTGHG